MPLTRSRPTLAVALTLAFAGMAAGARLTALYVMVETRQVPVERLVRNLERQLAANPGDPALHVKLARLHGMAWALKTETVEAAERQPGQLEPWYGYNPDLVPYRRKVQKGTPEERQAAREHLDRALEHYRAALKLDSDNLLANLGYGWMLEQAGDTARAMEHYRRVVERAWPAERQQKIGGLTKFFTYEAAGYLIPLLDRETDAAEIARLREMREHFDSLPRAITPIAVPLVPDLAPDRVLDRTARVRFDADGTGLRREWTWISRRAAWLVHDPDGGGRIPSALQLFGSVTFWLFWENGYHALAALDDDGSGEIEGAELRGLALWHDENANGVSECGEVRPLAAHGIAALAYEHEEGDGVSFAALSRRGARMQSGEVRPTYDVILESGQKMTN